MFPNLHCSGVLSMIQTFLPIKLFCLGNEKEYWNVPFQFIHKIKEFCSAPHIPLNSLMNQKEKHFLYFFSLHWGLGTNNSQVRVMPHLTLSAICVHWYFLTHFPRPLFSFKINFLFCIKPLPSIQSPLNSYFNMKSKL